MKKIFGLKMFLFMYIVFVFEPGVINHAISQDKKVDIYKTLRDRAISVYDSKGKSGFLDFIKDDVNKISLEFIVDLAELGLNERNEKYLELGLILAEEKKDEKILVNVLVRMGKYFLNRSNFEKANYYFDAAVPICEKTNYESSLGIIFQSKGSIALYTGKNSDALKMFEKALFIFKKINYSWGEGNTYFEMGRLYFYTGLNDKAFTMLDRAEILLKKNNNIQGLGNLFLFKGEIYFLMGENSKSLCAYEKALYYYKKEKEIFSCGTVYLNKSKIYIREKNYPKAILAINIAEKYYKISNSLLQLGHLYNNKSKIYSQTGNYLKAETLLKKSLGYYEKANSLNGQGTAYMFMGDIYYLTDNYQIAIEMFKKASLFFEKCENTRNLGNISFRIGDIYAMRGDILKALEMYEKSISYFKNADYPVGLNSSYFRKAMIYLQMNNILKANDYFEKSLVFSQKIGDYNMVGDCFALSANINFLSKNYQKAIDLCRKSLRYYQRGKPPMGIALIYFTMSISYLEMNIHSKALFMSQKALNYYLKANHISGQSDCYRNFGDIYFNLKIYHKALKAYEKSLRLSNKIDYMKNLSYISYKKAIILGKFGKIDKALKLFEEGISQMDKFRMKATFTEMKKCFMTKSLKQYEDATLFALKNNIFDRGFKHNESMRSRLFLDHLAEGFARIDKGISLRLKEERDNLLAKLSANEKQLYETKEKKDEKKIQNLKEIKRKLENDFDDLLINIRLENPLYASVQYPEPITVEVMQKNVLKPREILISYFVSKKKTYAFVLSKENFQVVPLNISESQINTACQDYLKAILDNDSSRITRFGKMLYRDIFKPVEKFLKENQEIVIAPDGVLATISFEAFITESEEQDRPVYLLDKYKIKYIQSASVLSMIRKYFQRNSQTNSFIGFGDPVYDYENFKQGKPEKGSSNDSTRRDDEIAEIHRSRYTRDGGSTNRLIYSGEEIKSIANLFEKNSMKIQLYLRDQATETNAKSLLLKDFDYIHLACHGLINEDFQSLVLSQLPTDKSPDDGYFTLNEIMNCEYNAKLIVLSACDTGKGKMERGEGITGLTRAFMYAGSPAVVVTLWNVHDEASKDLMVLFYKNIIEKKMDKTEALRQAKLELLKNPTYSSPLFWSSFILYGE